METITYQVTSQVPFTLHLRIPGWCKKATITLDGKVLRPEVHLGFVCVAIPGSCTLSISMVSEIQTHHADGFVWFSKGPLVYSLGMKGRREIDTSEPKSSPAFPAYNIYPDRPWRYCITGTPTFHSCPEATRFDLDAPLPYLEVPAKEITNWDLEHKNKVRNYYNLYEGKYNYRRGDFTFTPPLLSNRKIHLASTPSAMIRLYPYGACKLRMTVFNQKHFFPEE